MAHEEAAEPAAAGGSEKAALPIACSPVSQEDGTDVAHSQEGEVHDNLVLRASLVHICRDHPWFSVGSQLVLTKAFRLEFRWFSVGSQLVLSWFSVGSCGVCSI